MLAVLITLTPGRRTEFLDCQKGKVRIAVLPIMDVKTRWNSTLELLERAYRLRDFTREWLKNPKYTDCRALYTTEDEWKVVLYVMEVLRPFRYWTLWMSKRQTVTLHQVVMVYNDMFDHMDAVMRALVKKRTPWKEDLYFAVQAARQKLTKYYSEVRPETGMLLIAAHILDPYRKLRSFRKWDKALDVSPEEEGSFTAQYKDAFLKYVEREYCGRSSSPAAIKTETDSSTDPFAPTTASGPGESSYNPYDLSSDDDEYLAPKDFVHATPGRSDREARLLTATNLYLNSPPEVAKMWGQTNPKINDYHCDPLEVSGTFWTPDITTWWRQQEESHGTYAVLANVARDVFSVMPHGVGVEASFSLGRDVIGWRQSKTTGATLREKVVVRQFARANNGVLAGDEADSGPDALENNTEIKKEAEQKKLHRLAKVHDFLELWRGSQELRVTQKASRAQNAAMTAMGYISDTEETQEKSWSTFAHDGVVAFKSNEKALPKSLPLTEIGDGQARVRHFRRIRRIDRHPNDTDGDSGGEGHSDTEDWLNWNGDFDDEDGDDENDSSADEDLDSALASISRTKVIPDPSRVDAALNIPGLIRPVRKSSRIRQLAVMESATAKVVQTTRGRGGKRK